MQSYLGTLLFNQVVEGILENPPGDTNISN